MNKFEEKQLDPLRRFRQKKSKKDAYMGGYDFGVNGGTDKNCHPMFFSSAEKTKAWEEGKADATAGKPNKFQP